jgi:hypothetical protein
MRLMLGTKDKPSLLVEPKDEPVMGTFDFWVVNGAWEGSYTNGHVTVWYPDAPWTELDKVEILCDNQDRLRGEYQMVFDNFDNENWVSPVKAFVTPDDWDDDIPF